MGCHGTLMYYIATFGFPNSLNYIQTLQWNWLPFRKLNFRRQIRIFFRNNTYVSVVVFFFLQFQSGSKIIYHTVIYKAAYEQNCSNRSLAPVNNIWMWLFVEDSSMEIVFRFPLWFSHQLGKIWKTGIFTQLRFLMVSYLAKNIDRWHGTIFKYTIKFVRNIWFVINYDFQFKRIEQMANQRFSMI